MQFHPQSSVTAYHRQHTLLLYPFVWIMLIHDTGSSPKFLGKIRTNTSRFLKLFTLSTQLCTIV